MSLGDVTSMRAGVLERLGGTRADVVCIGLIFLLLTNYSQISPYDTITVLVLLVPKILNFSSTSITWTVLQANTCVFALLWPVYFPVKGVRLL